MTLLPVLGLGGKLAVGCTLSAAGCMQALVVESLATTQVDTHVADRERISQAREWGLVMRTDPLEVEGELAHLALAGDQSE